jgi:hypothetical protein
MVFVGNPFVVLFVILLLPNDTMCPPLALLKPVVLSTTVTLLMLIVAFTLSESIAVPFPEAIELSRFSTVGAFEPDCEASVNPKTTLPATTVFRTETVV